MDSKPIDISPFPNGIGQIIKYKAFDYRQKIELPPKTIIRIYGLAGAGKGTLSNQLVDTLNVINLETSNILRTCTWIYKTLDLEFNDRNTDKVFAEFKVSLNHKRLEFFWKGKILSATELRSEVVDQNVPIYSGDPYFRSKYYNIINYILENLVSSPVILDGRGSNTPYLEKAEKSGFNIIRIFLWVNKQVSFKRYLSRKNISSEDILNLETIKNEFEKNVIQRDISDFRNTVTNNLGSISKDTGIIDTSDLLPSQVQEIALNFIIQNLPKSL